MNIDLINGCFEMGAGLLQISNIYKLSKHKQVKGVSMYPFLLFTLWGIWNLYYYPALGQTLSFIGGIVIVVTNIIWISLALYYRKNQNK